MLLGLHTYSFHLHGMGQDWGGFEHSWPRAMDLFQLMDYAVSKGLDGLHITAADCERVSAATDAVEMNQEPSAAFNPDAAVCSAGEIPNDVFFDDFESGLAN